MLSTVAPRWNRSCAPWSENTAIVALPSESTPPNVTMPVILYLRTGPRALAPIESPTL